MRNYRDNLSAIDISDNLLPIIVIVQNSFNLSITDQGCELDRFLTKFEFKRYLQVRVLRILFFEFEFGKNDRVQPVQVRVAALDFIGRDGMNK